MPKTLRIYKFCLKLYPKQYRRQYGDQMVQTLEDMLAGAADPSQRFVIWLRAGSELPISIMHENITNLGDNPMNKLAFTSNKRLITFTSIFVVILVALLFHGFVRVRTQVVPNLVGLVYKHSITTTFNNQNIQQLANPLVKLYGFTDDHHFGCSTAAAQNIRVAVDCQILAAGYGKLDQTPTGKAFVKKNVQLIEKSLKANGFVSPKNGNGVTLTSLVNGTYQGKDYMPDALYVKNFGAYSCTFDTNIAYSNPKQPTIGSALNCSRRINVFGTPSMQPTVIIRSQTNK